MKSISFETVLSSLDSWSLVYEVIRNGNDNKDYSVASLFEPVPNGFYFAKENIVIPDFVTDSLIILDETIEKKENNAYIQVQNIDPQQVYYLILNKLFPIRSSGKISQLSTIHPEAKIGHNVQIDDFCVIGKCEIGDDSIIGSHCKIHDNTEIGFGNIIESLSIIGTQGVAWIWNTEQTQRIIQPQLGGVKIGNNCFLGANTIIVRGASNENTTIGDNSLLAPSSRLGHGTKIGEFVHLANNIVTGGNTIIGDFSFIGSNATFRPKVKIHPKTIVGAGALVIKNTTKEGLTLVGAPAKEINSKSNPAGMPKPKI